MFLLYLVDVFILVHYVIIFETSITLYQAFVALSEHGKQFSVFIYAFGDILLRCVYCSSLGVQ